MSQQPRKKSKLPAKWGILGLLLVVAYGFLQPLANSQWGWSLPTLGSLSGDQSASPNISPPVGRSGSRIDEQNQAGRQANPGLAGTLASGSGSTQGETSTSAGISSTATAGGDSAIGTFGFLRAVGEAEYLSPAGLRYTRGSQEGHRLKHLARHLRDQPDRPGLHGVFTAEMHQVLGWIDDTYSRAEQGKPRTSRKVNDGRVIYEAEFAEPIGFVGGREGGKRGNPPADQLRLVVEGRRVITAFPF